jgi:peptidyl-prolyl cis-trans isomerase SurA
MGEMRYKSTRCCRRGMALPLMLALVSMLALLSVCTLPIAAQGKKPAPGEGTGAEVTLDRVAAIVNGQLILESDVDAERRMAAFQPFTMAKTLTRDQLINRLIDRALIEQQMALQPEAPITDAEVDDELATLRKSIPKCAAYHCETEAGWEKFVADQGFTMQELKDRWKQRMEVLRFIEERFRMGIRISPAEIDTYYKTTLVPAYEKENATAPAEATIAPKIQEILLQQQVDKLLDDWLTALRAQGSVTILKPGEEAP